MNRVAVNLRWRWILATQPEVDTAADQTRSVRTAAEPPAAAAVNSSPPTAPAAAVAAAVAVDGKSVMTRAVGRQRRPLLDCSSRGAAERPAAQ